MSNEDLAREVERLHAVNTSLTTNLKALRRVFPEGFATVEAQNVLRDVDSELAAQGVVRVGAVTWVRR